jgi:hypothetical protein
MHTIQLRIPVVIPESFVVEGAIAEELFSILDTRIYELNPLLEGLTIINYQEKSKDFCIEIIEVKEDWKEIKKIITKNKLKNNLNKIDVDLDIL